MTAGLEFYLLKVYFLIKTKSLCGLRTSRFSWHEILANFLRGVGFQPCNIEPVIWMRRVDNE